MPGKQTLWRMPIRTMNLGRGERQMADWFEQPEAEVLAGLDSGRQGIDSGEAQQRLKEYGENVLEEAGRLQWWQVFLAQFKDLLVIILIGAAAVSMLTGDPESAMAVSYTHLTLPTIA